MNHHQVEGLALHAAALAVLYLRQSRQRSILLTTPSGQRFTVDWLQSKLQRGPVAAFEMVAGSTVRW